MKKVRVYTCMHCGLTQKKCPIRTEEIALLMCVGCFIFVRVDEVIGWLEDERKVLA